MKIIDLDRNPDTLHQVCDLLVNSFEYAWHDLKEASEEVEQTLESGRISRVAIDETGKVLGWIAGSSNYGGNVWELHPLVVHHNHRKLGIGRQLVVDFEHQVRIHGGITITLGTDDESGETTMSNVDLYLDLPELIRNFRVTGTSRHLRKTRVRSHWRCA